MTEKRTLNGFVVASTRKLDCPHCHGKETLRVDYDENGCARWGYCRSCGGDGPFSPCQECKKDPKPCQSNAGLHRTEPAAGSGTVRGLVGASESGPEKD